MQGTPFLFQHSHWQLSHAPTISSHNSSSRSTSGNSGRRTDCTKYRRFPPWDHSHSTCSALHKDALLIVSRVWSVAILLLCDAFHIPDVVQCTIKCWHNTVPLDCSCTGQCFSLNCEVLAAEEAVITGHAVPTPFILKHHHHHIDSTPSNYYCWFEFLSTYHQAWITQHVSNPSFLSLTCKMFSEIFLQSNFFCS